MLINPNIAARLGRSFTLTAIFMSATAFAADAPPTSPHTFTPNIGVVSDYLFRGISQTRGGAALQGGIDYAHTSGLYAGVWGSTITWVKDWLGKGSTEVDLYGGYKNTFAGGDWNYDVGVITYLYPGKGNAIPSVLANPNTTEVYAAIGYKWLTLKYSQAVSKNFIGWYGGKNLDLNTRGSGYLELNASYDVGGGWSLTGHYGAQQIKNSVITAAGTNSGNYSDWKLGVTKDVGFGVVGLAYSDTNISGTCRSITGGSNAYCWGNGNFVSGVGPTSGFKNVAKGQAVLSYLMNF